MCNPLAIGIIGAVISAAGTGMSISAQNKASEQQAEAIRLQGEANREALTLRSKEVRESADLEKEQRRQQQQREVAGKRVAMSEGGILFGNTALRHLATSLISGGQDAALIDKQEERIQDQIANQMRASAAGQQLQLAGLQWTSPLAAGLNIGASGLSGYLSAGGPTGASPSSKTGTNPKIS